MSEEKRFRPVHEICIAQLLESCASAVKIQHWAEIYSEGAIAPLDSIPRLIEAFQRAESMLEGQIEIPEIASAIACLKRQLKEGIVIGDYVSFKKAVIDSIGSCKHCVDPRDALVGRVSPKDKFKVLDIDSNGKAVLDGWCVISDTVSIPIPIDLKLLKKVVSKESVCEAHDSIKHK